MKSIIIDKTNVPENIYYLLESYKEKYYDWVIGGGFARFIGHKVFNIKWGSDLHIVDYLKEFGGDIDFFSTSSVCNSTFASLETENTISSFLDILYDYHDPYKNLKADIVTFGSAFADNSSVSFYMPRKNKYDKLVCLNLRKQFITEFSYNSIEEMCENFDITNSQWFIKFYSNKIKLVYSEEAKRLDELELIDINKDIANPFLANRINKYVTNRGLVKGLNEESKDNFNHFLISAATDAWKDEFVKLMVSEDVIRLSSYPAKTLYNRTKSHMTFDVLNKLLKINMLSKNNLTLFIGRWKTTVMENQGASYSESSPLKMFPLGDIYSNKYKEVDWASHNINLLS